MPDTSLHLAFIQDVSTIINELARAGTNNSRNSIFALYLYCMAHDTWARSCVVYQYFYMKIPYISHVFVCLLHKATRAYPCLLKENTFELLGNESVL